MTLWGQDTAQRDFNAMLFTRKGSDNANLVRKMRWRDSLPVRYIEFEASQCGREENLKYIRHGKETELDISQWAVGSYVVRMHTPQGTASRRLVVE